MPGLGAAAVKATGLTKLKDGILEALARKLGATLRVVQPFAPGIGHRLTLVIRQNHCAVDLGGNADVLLLIHGTDIFATGCLHALHRGRPPEVQLLHHPPFVTQPGTRAQGCRGVH